ncbi:hypothetical protein [Chitinophaga sp. YR573]|uniref:hypothetical protein n=1 Tax=Chitinophaga sp. YR573 TaxID=1881040 RepID=UPI00115FFD2D|nr:hypothetical protein [Chitinophaga sp. YR573]
MAHIINNLLDLLWLLIGGISVVVLIAIFVPWKFIYELILFTLVVIWFAIMFYVTEGWKALKKRIRKRHRWIEMSDQNDLFI